MRKKRLYWTLQILGWSIYLALNFITTSIINPQEMTEGEINNELLGHVVHTTVLALLSHLVIRKTIIDREWVQINISRVIPRLFLLIFLSVILAQIIILPILSIFRDLELDTALGASNFLLLPSLSYIVLFIVWCSVYILYHYLESNNRSLKYEAAMNEMHLNQLKSQLNPHFIFNALNSMRALVDEEPEKAKVAITQLSNILRNSLITDMKKVVNFRNELNTVRNYLALESIRFEERLQVKFDIAPGSDHFEVPPMMLQTLTENAIKHGVSNLLRGGLIHISTTIKDSKMQVKIKNSGQLKNGTKAKAKSTGVGLVNTQERLKLIYGDSASFKMYNENDKFVVVEVNIPQRI